MPCDPKIINYEDAHEGDILVTLTGMTYKVRKEMHFPNIKGYVSHFATCPQASDWRKKK